VIVSWTTCVRVYSFLLSLFYCTLLYSHVCSVSVLCSSRGFLMFFSLLSQEHLMYNSWSLGIYSCRYSLVSLCFTNWLNPYFLLKSLLGLQSEPSLKIITIVDILLTLSYTIYLSHSVPAICSNLQITHSLICTPQSFQVQITSLYFPLDILASFFSNSMDFHS